MTDTNPNPPTATGDAALPYLAGLAVAKFRIAEYQRLKLARAEDELAQAVEQMPTAQAGAYYAATEPIRAATDERIEQIEARAAARHQPERCPIHGRSLAACSHPAPEVVTVAIPGPAAGQTAAATLIVGAEYIIRHRIEGVQRFDRQSRMGFIGKTPAGQLQFSARGPGGTHDGEYGGTQTMEPRWIVTVEQVERNDQARYIARRAPARVTR